MYSGGQGRPYLVEGIGEDFWPATYDRSIADRVVMVSDRDSFLTARRVTREEGILAGGSCGTAVWAALEVGRDLGPDAVIVVILPDSGRGYLSKVYDDGWMADHGFLRASGGAGDTVEAVVAHKAQAAAAQAGGGAASPGPRPPQRDRPGGHRSPAGVRRIADAGRQGRAAAGAGRGGRHRHRPGPAGAAGRRSDRG